MGYDDKDNKNPWGQRPGNDDRGPWGSQGNRPGNRGGRGGQEPPDLDEMLRKAQDNLHSFMPKNFHGIPLVGLVIIAIALLWLASGFYVVNPGENAVIQRFGSWSRTQAEPGLGYHLPAPIESRTVLNVREPRVINIGFTEGITRSGTAGQRDIPDESLMLTSDRNIVDVNIVIQWNIKSAEDFLFNVHNQEAIIKSITESAIREVVGQTQMFTIITTGRAGVADRTRAIIQRNLDEYKSGVNITQVLIRKAVVHPDVQPAFQDVQAAKQDAEDTQNRANAYREDILPKARGQAIQMLQEAEGYKDSNIAKAKGDADRFNAVYQAYLSGEDVTKERIYIETMENVLKNAQKIILDNKAGQGAVPYLPLESLNKPTATQKSGDAQ